MANTKKSEKESTVIIFSLPPEIRNIIYELTLEAEKEALEGDNKVSVVGHGNLWNISWRSLEATRIPGLCQVTTEVCKETNPMLKMMYHDWLPAFKVFRFGRNCLGEWLEVFGDRILPHLRWFVIDTGTSRLTFVLDGSDDDLEIITREEAHEVSGEVSGLGVAVTCYHGQIMGEYVPAVVEYAVRNILAELEDAMEGASPQRLTKKTMKHLARFCRRELEDDDEESDDESGDEESDE